MHNNEKLTNLTCIMDEKLGWKFHNEWKKKKNYKWMKTYQMDEKFKFWICTMNEKLKDITSKYDIYDCINDYICSCLC